MARGDAVNGVGIVRYADSVSGQLLPESYRPGAGHLRSLPQLGDPLGQLLGSVHGPLPEPLSVRCVERGEHLAAPAVEHRQRQAVPFARYIAKRNRRVSRLLDPPRHGVERADTPYRNAEADREAAGGCDPDPDPGEGPRAEADREQVDLLPAAGRRRRALDLDQQSSRVQRPSLRRKAELRLVQDVAVPPGAGDRIGGRGVEADDDQGEATQSPGRPRSPLSCL